MLFQDDIKDGENGAHKWGENVNNTIKKGNKWSKEELRNATMKCNLVMMDNTNGTVQKKYKGEQEKEEETNGVTLHQILYSN